MKKIIAFLVSVVMFSEFAFAQSGFKALGSEDSPRRGMDITEPAPAAQLPRIIVAAGRKPVILRDLKVDIEVIGNLAMTTYEMVFYNPNRLVMEGEFVLPLAQNQNVSAIALDINGKMREGVAVEKRKARETFETVVRRGIDPALAEKTSANLFSLRIYPFSPEGVRRVRITVEEPLVSKNNGYIYNLPLNFGREINFEINAQIPADSAASVPETETDLAGFSFGKINDSFKASFSGKNYFLNGRLSFFLPKPKREPVFTHTDGDETYFYTDINIRASSKDKILPKKIAVVWDSSLSSLKRDLEREKRLLGAYLKKLPEAEVVFMTFNIEPGAARKFKIKNGVWDALEKAIGEIIYDGGTRFDKLDFGSLNADEILLFTDGISTFGDTRIGKSKAPVFVVSSSEEFNRGGLAGAAVESGGSFINLQSLTDEEAALMLVKKNLKFISYSSARGKISEVYPRPGTDVAENFTFAAILNGGEDEMVLNFGYGKNDITETKKIKIKSGGDNSAVARLWAVQKIKDLETDSAQNESEILKLGRQYCVVTEFSSLLVLEDARDYAAYKITPPQELLAQYNRILGDIKKKEEDVRKSALEDAIRRAKELKEWWEKDFDRSKPPQKFEKLKQASFAGAREVSRADSVRNIYQDVSPDVAMETYIAQESGFAEESVSAEISGASRRAPAENKAKSSGAGEPAQARMEAGVRIKAWDPQTPYMKILKKSADGLLYQDYLKLRAGYDDQPSFFFDVTDEFIRRKMKDKALTVLSNIAEMKLDNPELLRTAANKLMELGEYRYAADIFEKILKLRGEHPQSYRDLALAFQANKEYGKALEMFYKVLTGSWNRFDSVKQIVFVEMNNLIALNPKLDLSGIDKELIFAMPVDIRVVLGWSTDNTDIDIHVTDPYGEEAFYGNKLTRIGARVSQDLTQGFGPEEFMLKKAVEGDYRIFTNNFADGRQSVSGPTLLYIDIYTFYGTKKQTGRRVFVRTENIKESNTAGTVSFKK